MFGGNELSERWQFGVRDLLALMAMIAIGASSVSPVTGVICAALVGGVCSSAYRPDEDARRALGNVGALCGGAVAGIVQTIREVALFFESERSSQSVVGFLVYSPSSVR